jgi:hypothetical protein
MALAAILSGRLYAAEPRNSKSEEQWKHASGLAFLGYLADNWRMPVILPASITGSFEFLSGELQFLDRILKPV